MVNNAKKSDMRYKSDLLFLITDKYKLIGHSFLTSAYYSKIVSENNAVETTNFYNKIHNC